MDLPFWGTRLPHLFYIPASLVFFDHTVSSLFTRFLGMQSFAATPSLALVNLFCYTWLAVGSYICVDAAFSPFHEGRRMEHVKDCIKPLTVGTALLLYLCPCELSNLYNTEHMFRCRFVTVLTVID